MKPGEQEEPSLKRNVSLFQAIMYGVGLILGAGIYVLIGEAAGMAGNAMWISFVIAAAIATFTGFSYAELSSVFPKSAAEYVYVKNALGNNLVAFVTGWLITFVAIVSSAAVAIGFSGYLTTFLPQLDPILSAAALVGWEKLSSTEAPLALATEQAFGRTGATVLSAIALFATSNTVLMLLVAGSRIMFGLSRERALPLALGRVHPKTKTLWISVVLTMLLALGVVGLSQGKIPKVANAAVFAIFLVYALVNLSLIWLRYKRAEIKRSFVSPVTVGKFPVLAGLGLATSVIMLTQFDTTSYVTVFSAIIIGLASYVVIEKFKKSRQLGDGIT